MALISLRVSLCQSLGLRLRQDSVPLSPSPCPHHGPAAQTWVGPWELQLQPLYQCLCDIFFQVYRCGHRRHCYPTSWQRWIFYLLPGISMAALAITIYTSMMTSDNYYYTHSIWHMLLAGSAAFLLPPRDKHVEPWACSQKFTCHYQICKNHREELYTVT